jgi:hypothetical protein
MRLITCSFQFRNLIKNDLSKGKHTAARLAVHFKDVMDHFELTDGRLLGIAMDNASSNNLMTRELQSTHESSAIEWPELGNHIPCMPHIIQLALGAFMSSLGVKGCTKSWETLQCDMQCGENECIDIGKSQRLRQQGNSRINKVLPVRPGLAKIIEKVCIS